MVLKKREEYANGLNEAMRRLSRMHNDLYMEVFASQIALKNADKQYKKGTSAYTGDGTNAQYEKTRDYLTRTINEKKEEIKKLDLCIEYVGERYPRPGLFSKLSGSERSLRDIRNKLYDTYKNPVSLEKVSVSVKEHYGSYNPADLEKLIERLKQEREIVWTEDIRPTSG